MIDWREQVGCRVGRRRNEPVQERPARLKQCQAQRRDDQLSEIERLPDRSRPAARRGIIGSRNADRESRLLRAHHPPGILATGSCRGHDRRESFASWRPPIDQGTTQVKTVASPWGAISHWFSAAGSNNVWPNSSGTRFPPCSTIDVPFKPITIVNRSGLPRASAGPGSDVRGRSNAIAPAARVSRRRRWARGHGRERSDRAAVEIDRFHCLLQMKLSGLAVGPRASPVVDPEGGVGHLLDLGQQDAGADRVDGAGLDQDAVSRPGLEAVEQMFDLPRGDRGGEFVAARRLA